MKTCLNCIADSALHSSFMEQGGHKQLLSWLEECVLKSDDVPKQVKESF